MAASEGPLAESLRNSLYVFDAYNEVSDLWARYRLTVDEDSLHTAARVACDAWSRLTADRDYWLFIDSLPDLIDHNSDWREALERTDILALWEEDLLRALGIPPATVTKLITELVVTLDRLEEFPPSREDLRNLQQLANQIKDAVCAVPTLLGPSGKPEPGSQERSRFWQGVGILAHSVSGLAGAATIVVNATASGLTGGAALLSVISGAGTFLKSANGLFGR